MIKPIKLMIIVSCLLYLLLFFLLRGGERIEKTKLTVRQLSYVTTCAEEDNVILKISSSDRSIRGVTLLAKKPVFNQQKYEVFEDPDFSGCDWMKDDEVASEHLPVCPSGYYADNNGQCKEAVMETVFDNGKWRVVADRGEHWQPFMAVLDQNHRFIGEYKSLTIRRLEQPNVGDDLPNVAVIYSDGYLRSTYYVGSRMIPHGWGGSFILGDSKFIKEITPRFHNNIKQIKFVKPTGDDPDLRLELIFIKHRDDDPAKLVVHYDYNEKGIDFFPPKNRKELLTFVSMYRDKTSFDIETLRDRKGDKNLVYNVMDPLINKASFSELLFEKKNPSLHNTLSPDFAITGIVDR